MNSSVKGKGSPYSITERRVPELIPVLGSQPAGDVSHKPGGRLPLLSARPAVTPATLKRAAANFAAWRTEARWDANSLPKTVTRQRRDCDLNPGPSAPESSTLTTRLPSHPEQQCTVFEIRSLVVKQDIKFVVNLIFALFVLSCHVLPIIMVK